MQDTMFRKHSAEVQTLQARALSVLADLLQELETRVPLPTRTGPERYAYTDESEQQALVLLLARLISAVHAERLLLNAGMTLDVAAPAHVVGVMAARIDQVCGASATDVPAWLADFWAGRSESTFLAVHGATAIMTAYGVPEPRFKVAGSIHSSSWVDGSVELHAHVGIAFRSIARCAVAFGHLGLLRSAQACYAEYVEAIEALTTPASVRQVSVQPGCSVQ